MKADPKKAAKLFKELQRVWEPKPTFFHLAMFSGENDLEIMIQGIMEARKQVSSSR